MPTVTAIITTFNRRQFVANAIDSVLAQSLKDFELIVLDNDSNDGTADVVKGYGDPRIRYVKHPAMGIAAQRNLGVSLACSDYIAFLDDDDVWLPNKLQAQYDKFQSSGVHVGLIYGGFIFYDDDGREWGRHDPTLTGSVLEGLLWARDPFCGSASNPMLRASVVAALGGYDARIVVGEDWELYLRLAEQYGVEGVDELVLRIRQHSGPRLGQKIDAALGTERHVYLRFARSMSTALKSLYLQKIGGKYIRLGHLRRGRKLIALAIKVLPTNVYAYGQLALSLVSERTYRYMHRKYLAYLRSW